MTRSERFSCNTSARECAGSVERSSSRCCLAPRGPMQRVRRRDRRLADTAFADEEGEARHGPISHSRSSRGKRVLPPPLKSREAYPSSASRPPRDDKDKKACNGAAKPAPFQNTPHFRPEGLGLFEVTSFWSYPRTRVRWVFTSHYAMKLFLAAVFLLVSSLAATLAQQAPASSTTPSSSAKDAAQAPSTNPTTPQPSVTPPTPGKPSTPPSPQAGTVQSATPPDYSQEAYVVEHSSQKMRYENDGTGGLENEAQIKIISESGVQALGQLKVGYNAHEREAGDRLRARAQARRQRGERAGIGSAGSDLS